MSWYWAFGIIAVAALGYAFKGFWEQWGKNLADMISRPEEPLAPQLPATPTLVEVGQHFQAKGEHAGNCAWVREGDVYERQQQGYSFYVEDDPDARMFRQIPGHREFLMVRPPQA